jgi:hypothetical protein
MKILTREQLYAWIWTCPVTKVATELGISGSALAKKCRINEIPTPGRGYWRQLEQGKKVARTPLVSLAIGKEKYLGEITDDRAAALYELVTAMVSENADSNVSENRESAPKILDHVSGGRDSRTDSVAVGPSALLAIESTPASQPSRSFLRRQATLDPSEILAVAAQTDRLESARRFMAELRIAGQECDSPTRAVLVLWLESATNVLEQLSPIDRVIQDCQQVAAGTVNPPWFDSKLKRAETT